MSLFSSQNTESLNPEELNTFKKTTDVNKFKSFFSVKI